MEKKSAKLMKNIKSTIIKAILKPPLCKYIGVKEEAVVSAAKFPVE
jgi:hypothetical protein